MDQQRWRRVRELFELARGLESERRAALLDERCGGDSELRAEVESLLRREETSPDPVGAVVQRALGAVDPDLGAAKRRDDEPTLTTGHQIGHYRILKRLGGGGMGEVYLADDRELRRGVALKLLARWLVNDPEVLRRFKREGRLLASLNHPNVVTVYSVEEVGGVHFITMELVEGDTLADRIPEGGLDLAYFFELALPLVDALGAAHAEGLVHRDVKPQNVMVDREGRIKVLDFGLGKRIAATSDTLSLSEDTQAGTLLGTVSYMSPEQAEGEPVDARSDVFSLGVVLYEMLSGTRPFQARSDAGTFAAILRSSPPPLGAVRREIPAELERLVHRCLEKEPERRYPSAGELRTDLARCRDDALGPQAVPARRASSSSSWKGALSGSLAEPGAGRAVLLRLGGWTGAVGAVLVTVTLVPQLCERERQVPRMANPRQVTAAIGVEDSPTWSPDGRTVAYESNQTGNWDIWVSQPGGGQSVNRTQDHLGADRYPSWSRDGRQIAFWSERDGGGYFLMPALGGSAARLAATPVSDYTYHSPAAWSETGDELAYVVYEPVGSAFDASLEIVSLTTRDTRRLPLTGSQECRLDPSWSPDGRLIAYLDTSRQYAETAQLLVAQVSGAATAVAVTGDRANVRSPFWSRDGTALYYVANRVGSADIWRQPVDQVGRPLGEPQQITTGLEVLHASLSADGTSVAYSKGRWVANVWRLPILAERRATWDDAEQLTFERAFIEMVDVSPDGQHLAFSSDRAGNQDLWRMRIGADEPTRLTSDPAPEWGPNWSPDGRELAFYSYRTGDREIWAMPAEGGPARQLTSSPGMDAGPRWSPDGLRITFRSERQGSSDIFVMNKDGTDLRAITSDPHPDALSSWSPNGRWIAFLSYRDGSGRIWRAPDQGGEPEPVTGGGASAPMWSEDSTEIVFQREDDFWSVDLQSGHERQATELLGRRGRLIDHPTAVHGGQIYFSWRDDVGDIWVMDLLDGVREERAEGR